MSVADIRTNFAGGVGTQAGPRRLSARRFESLRAILLAGDVACVLIPWAILAALTGSTVSDQGVSTFLARMSIAVLVVLGTFVGAGLYRAGRSSVVSHEVTIIGRATARVLTALLLFEALSDTGARLWSLVVPAIWGGLLLIFWRSAFRAAMRASRRLGHRVRPVVLVGIDAEALRLVKVLEDHPDAGFRIVGVAGDRDAADSVGLGELWLGSSEKAVEAVQEGTATGVLLVPTALTGAEVSTLTRRVSEAGGYVHMSSGLAQFPQRTVHVQPIAHEPLLCVSPVDPTQRLHSAQAVLKRMLDVSISFAGLVALAPILTIAAVAIKLQDGGPVLFRQRRVGRDGAEFTILKLRTMVVDAESEVANLAHLNRRQGPLFKVDSDPRITRLGRFLRSSDLDEIPQLWNVLRGQMSLVGPRPALPSEVEHFDDELRRRAEVLPGITGLWQVESRDHPSFDAYQRLDLFYVQNWSVGFDLVIILLTIEARLTSHLGRLRSRRLARRESRPSDTIADAA